MTVKCTSGHAENVTLICLRSLTQTAFAAGQDPCHSGDCVGEQIGNANTGFVSNYARTHPDDTEPDRVMGYYEGSDLRVYDYLTQEFCVCDRWFSPVPGATWPNRLYAVTGRAAGSKDNKKVPLYDIPAFVRQLDTHGVSWRWYSHDVVPTLQLIDSHYRLDLSHFHYFDRQTLLGKKSFLEHAAAGKLPSVSWIDPNFFDFNATGANDDHAPGDVRAGQDLVLRLYDALVHSPLWEKTLLVVTYDEHGGFYDHVSPPAAQDDSPKFRTYGLRVPTLVISPWVDQGMVSNSVFDHTSIIKSILLRFCQSNDRSIPDLGTRVNAANHLGSLLVRATPRQANSFANDEPLIEWVGDWKKTAFKAHLSQDARTKRITPPPLTEFQRGLRATKRRLVADGAVKSF